MFGIHLRHYASSVDGAHQIVNLVDHDHGVIEQRGAQRTGAALRIQALECLFGELGRGHTIIVDESEPVIHVRGNLSLDRFLLCAQGGPVRGARSRYPATAVFAHPLGRQTKGVREPGKGGAGAGRRHESPVIIGAEGIVAALGEILAIVIGQRGGSQNVDCLATAPV